MFFRHKAQFAGFALKDGLSVEVRATPSIFEARGEFQLNVETVRLAGIGALYEKFERLKARLAAAGWFAEERKRPLPALPRAIGIVTSPRARGASRHPDDACQRRWPRDIGDPLSGRRPGRGRRSRDRRGDRRRERAAPRSTC